MEGKKKENYREKRKASINFSNYYLAMVIIVTHYILSIHYRAGTVLGPLEQPYEIIIAHSSYCGSAQG